MEPEFEDDVIDTVEDTEIDDGVEVDEDEAPEAAPEEPRKSRAQARIKELVSEKNRTRQELEEARKEIQALRESTQTIEKTNAEASVKLIDSQIASLKMNLRAAQESGDIDQIIALNEKLVDLSVDKRIAEAKATKPVAAPAKPATTAQTPKIPEEMQYWLEDNQWVLSPKTDTDRQKVRALRRVSRELEQEGYLPEYSDYYEELDARIQEVVGSTAKTGVKYNKDSGSSPQDGKMRKSPVSQSSRTPVSRRVRNTLTPEEKRMATMLGIPEDMYAESKRRREESEDGRVTLF